MFCFFYYIFFSVLWWDAHTWVFGSFSDSVLFFWQVPVGVTAAAQGDPNGLFWKISHLRYWCVKVSLYYVIYNSLWLTSAAICPPDWRLYPEDPVHAARPSDHIPPQPAAWKCCGLLQFKRRGRQSPEEPAHVRTTHTHTLSLHLVLRWTAISHRPDG